MEKITAFFSTYFDWLYFPKMAINDVLDILIIAYLLYHILIWFRTSRAKTLARGIALILLLLMIAAVLKLNTLLWIAKTIANVIVIAFIILFQPELRHALDELGRNKLFTMFRNDLRGNDGKRLSDITIEEIIKAVKILGEAKTGALIVVEHDTPLGEWENTGIPIDAVVSNELLINIFEKNTPLHDGAVIIRDNRVVSATCYLPLTENKDLNKEFGTRHRAGLGISEGTDSVTIIVSEETGHISIAYKGELYRHLDSHGVRKHLNAIQDPAPEPRQKGRILRKDGKKNGKEE